MSYKIQVVTLICVNNQIKESMSDLTFHFLFITLTSCLLSLFYKRCHFLTTRIRSKLSALLQCFDVHYILLINFYIKHNRWVILVVSEQNSTNKSFLILRCSVILYHLQIKDSSEQPLSLSRCNSFADGLNMLAGVSLWFISFLCTVCN